MRLGGRRGDWVRDRNVVASSDAVSFNGTADESLLHRRTRIILNPAKREVHVFVDEVEVILRRVYRGG